MTNGPRSMICPICKKSFADNDELVRLPFCDERCKLIDLGRWLRGAYQVPVDEAPDRNEEP